MQSIVKSLFWLAPLVFLLMGANIDSEMDFGTPQSSSSSVYSVNWNNLYNSNVIVDGNVLKNLNTSSGIHCFATASNVLTSGTDGWIEYTVASIKNKSFGLRDANITTLNDLSDYDYGFAIRASGNIQTMLSGTLTTIGSAQMDDVLRLEKIGTTLYYKKNGTTLTTVSMGTDRDLVAAANITSKLSNLEAVTSSFPQTPDPGVDKGDNFAILKKQPDAGYHHTYNEYLNIRYEERYDLAATKTLIYRIYDSNHMLIAGANESGTATPSGAPTATLRYGLNYIHLNLGALGLTPGAFYNLEVSNRKGEVKYLRFVYENNNGNTP